jgi:hypothetical protein
MTSGLDGGAEGGPRIRTPDQRVRVFVSSTLTELAAERAAARTAITRMHLTRSCSSSGHGPTPA